ncbi:DUF2232 domain-containing protein [Enorma phocaeensis]|uniref:DUF2232 domain-containing protein n=1 Tax=Enorma phocaeensis TaxID=1871019 RepID=UPI000C81D81A|nr:DUF2232 domain-containing protein [Enorma phocaeensis]
MTPNDRRDTPQTGIFPAGVPHKDGALWYAEIAIAALIAAWGGMLGTLFLAFGVRVQAERSGARSFIPSFGAAAVGLVLAAVLLELGVLPTALVPACAGFVIAALMWARRATVLAVSVTVAVCAALGLAIDGISLAMQGMDVTKAMPALLVEASRLSVGTSIQGDLVVATAEPIFRAVWPFVYVMTALIDVGMAGLGSFWGAQRGAPGFASQQGMPPARMPKIARFDAPLWAVVLLAASIVGIAVAQAMGNGAELLLAASVTLLLSVRFIFALQGFGVLFGLMDRWRLGCFIRAVAIVIAVWLEAMFLLSIVGLVDVWANFRKLPRNDARTEAQDK